jgi:hypothetical protein
MWVIQIIFPVAAGNIKQDKMQLMKIAWLENWDKGKWSSFICHFSRRSGYKFVSVWLHGHEQHKRLLIGWFLVNMRRGGEFLEHLRDLKEGSASSNEAVIWQGGRWCRVTCRHRFLVEWCWQEYTEVKVKLSHYRTGAALRFVGGWGSQNFKTVGT